MLSLGTLDKLLNVSATALKRMFHAWLCCPFLIDRVHRDERTLYIQVDIFRSLVGADLFLPQPPTQRALYSSCAGALLVKGFMATAQVADFLNAPTDASTNHDSRRTRMCELAHCIQAVTLDRAESRQSCCVETLQALQCPLVIKLCRGMTIKLSRKSH